MREATIHCAVRDADVRVLLTDPPVYDGQASIGDAELLCLEIGDACTGHTCPLGAEAPTVMDIVEARLGINPEFHAVVRGHCDGCDRWADLCCSLGGYLTCTECGTTVRAGSRP